MRFNWKHFAAGLAILLALGAAGLMATAPGRALAAEIIGINQGGLGAAWVDPNADVLLGWDDSAGGMIGFTPGAGIRPRGTTVFGEQSAILSSAYTLTSASTQQKLFNVPSGGAFTVEANRTYAFSCFLGLSSRSATSGNLSFSPLGLGASGGTATITNCTWQAVGLDADTPGTAAAVSGCNYLGTTADPISSGNVVVAGTGTGLMLWAVGSFRCTTAGTIIPSCSLTTAATPTVNSGSYFRLWDLGANTFTAGAGWS